MFVSLVYEGNYSQFMEVKDSVTNEKLFKVLLCFICMCKYTHTQAHAQSDVRCMLQIYTYISAKLAVHCMYFHVDRKIYQKF